MAQRQPLSLHPQIGIKPEDIDAVVFSHAHIDRIGGVVDESGKVLFPNAISRRATLTSGPTKARPADR
jgi:metal-dependent hydrolase (beta-lactamase superfamily II)